MVVRLHLEAPQLRAALAGFENVLCSLADTPPLSNTVRRFVLEKNDTAISVSRETREGFDKSF